MEIIFEDKKYDTPIKPQWGDYRYEPILRCNCRSTEHGHNLTGIAEVAGDYMLLHECPICGDKFRCHITVPHSEWKEELGLILSLYNPQFEINV